MKLLTIVLLYVFSLTVSGQDYFLSKKKLLKDYREYISILKDKHAGVYRYNTKHEFKNFTDSLRHEITDSISVYEFYKIISLVNAKLGCGHSKVDSPKDWIENDVLPPFSLYSSQGKYFVWHDLSIQGLNLENKEILSINGILINSIIEEIKSYIPADGYIDTGKKQNTEKLFPLYFAKYYSRNTENILSYKDDDESDCSVILQSQNINSLIERSKTLYPVNNSIISTSNELNYYYLKINSFFMDTVEFKNRIDSIFNIIVKESPKNLIIDLRENSGGKIVNEYYLLSYLIKNKIETLIKREYKINKKKFQEDTNVLGIIFPKNVYFFKNIYFIMDGLTYSAAGEFLSIAKHYQLGTFIGEETGAANDGCNAGKKSYTLKYSRFVFNVPDYKYTFEGTSSAKGRGIFPDYPVTYTKKDMISNTDVALNIINQLINGQISAK